MPSPQAIDVSITIRFGVPIVPIVPLSTLVLIFDKISKFYVIGYEQLGDESTGHWQCAVRMNESRTVNNTTLLIKRALKNLKNFEWTEHHEEYAVKVKKHPDLECLAGGYCSKQDFTPYVKGFDIAVLLKGKDRYVVACDGKKKKVPISKAGLVPMLRQYLVQIEERTTLSPDRDQKWIKLSSREKYEFVSRLIIVDGYDLSTISFLQKNDIIKNWSDYFENIKNPKNILDEFFE